MKEKYDDINFQGKVLKRIEQANQILEEYAAQDFTMSLRQLYYQFVSRDLIPNNITAYRNLSETVSRGRIAGLIDWDHIEDRTRSLQTHSSWEKPADIISDAAGDYREDLWKGQEYRPEVWVEKSALMGVIQPVCDEWRIPYFTTIGNCSQTEMRDAGQRFADHIFNGLTPVVLHLADHDPSGIGMTRDLRARLNMFARDDIEVRRIGLNIDQVRLYDPPPNPAKDTDPRFAAYAEEFGEQSWELDALAPSVLADLIRTELDEMIDLALWDDRKEEEKQNRALLTRVAKNWNRTSAEMRAPPPPY